MKIKNLKTTYAFTKNIFTTGALYETSRKAELEICAKLPSTENAIVVEFGLGHGNITREILSRLSPNAKLYSFEINKEFCEYVSDQINDDRLTIINEGAENISKHITGKVDAIVSSIPITIFPSDKKDEVLNTAYKALKPGAHFSQILYTKVLKKRISKIFDHLDIVRLFNIPMEYIHHCRKKIQ